MSRASHLNEVAYLRQPGLFTSAVAAKGPSPRRRARSAGGDDLRCAPHDRPLHVRAETFGDVATVAQLTSLFALLANETRLRVVLALRVPSTNGAGPVELCVCDLAVTAGASQSHTSHQLRALRLAGVVTARRAGKQMLYRLADAHLNHLLGDGLAYVRSHERP